MPEKVILDPKEHCTVTWLTLDLVDHVCCMAPNHELPCKCICGATK